MSNVSGQSRTPARKVRTASYIGAGVVAGGGWVQGYSRADKLMVSSMGTRWPNKQIAVNGTSAATRTKSGQRTSSRFLMSPWGLPAGTLMVFALPDVGVVEQNASTNEVNLTNDVTVEAFAITYLDAVGATKTVAATFPAGSVLKAASDKGGVLAHCVLPTDVSAYTVFSFAHALSFTAGMSLLGTYDAVTGDTYRADDATSFATVVTTNASLGTIGTSTTASFGGTLYGPALWTAYGADGRPIMHNDGDSISYGKGTPYAVAPNGVMGIVEVGMARRTGTYAIPVVNTAVAASGPRYTDPSDGNYNPNIAQGRRRLIDQITTLNGGVAPFTHHICEHGTNSLKPLAADHVSMMKSRHAWLKAWHNLPLVQTTMIPCTVTTDACQTLVNQTPYTYSATNESRWLANDKLMADRWDGSADFVVNTTVGLSYDQTTPNRDKWKIAPFTATLTRAIAASAAVLYLNAPPALGTALNIGGQTRVVTSVADQGGGEWMVNVTVGSSSGSYPASSIGQLVTELYCSDGQPNLVNMLHITKIANDNIAPQYDGLKATLKAAVNGNWV